jgi:hypothetical protein
VLGLLHLDQLFSEHLDLDAEFIDLGFVLGSFKGFEAIITKGIAQIGSNGGIHCLTLQRHCKIIIEIIYC